MNNNTKIAICFFNNREVRAIWGEEDNKWWFNVVDIAAVFEFVTVDGKKHLADGLDSEATVSFVKHFPDNNATNALDWK